MPAAGVFHRVDDVPVDAAVRRNGAADQTVGVQGTWDIVPALDAEAEKKPGQRLQAIRADAHSQSAANRTDRRPYNVEQASCGER